ncbi:MULTISPECIES: hypothetical protein [unclassified Rhizobium]|uniref:hypothetical protein n=1 Tax=unclassified Rhizobium TaxID=2613769 RepID=UPI0007020038|nr:MULTISPECIES: hypothetical protein [unclassified Rhizobium]KQV35544.1 hypothetical protein ASC86_09990 [Rhizobium sp. Root1212]KRD25650.1 hypothetical protein ASE37_09985 [Rhizobium sp. Root268]
MTKLPDLAHEVTELADNDWVYVYDVSNPADPDGKMLGSRFRPAGVRITNYLKFDGNITIPNLAAGAEADATVAVPGALVEDHVIFNLNLAPPANIAILATWAEADIVKVRFRNTHAATAFVTADVGCGALVIRSTT